VTPAVAILAQELKRLPTVQRTLHPRGLGDDEDEGILHRSLLAALLRGVTPLVTAGSWTMGWRLPKQNAMCTKEYSDTGTKFTSSTSSCTVRLAQGSVTVFSDMTLSSVEALLTASTQPPASVAISTDSAFSQRYSGVVMQFWCGTNLDHAVVAGGSWVCHHSTCARNLSVEFSSRLHCAGYVLFVKFLNFHQAEHCCNLEWKDSRHRLVGATESEANPYSPEFAA